MAAEVQEQKDGKREKGNGSGNVRGLSGTIGNQAMRLLTRAEKEQKVPMANVEIYTNSSKPADVGARAFAQGNKIYLGPGQEKHLSHEIGHVVQQKKGKVFPTGTVNGMPVNEDPKLEAEAEQMF